MNSKLENVLAYPERSLRTHPGKLLFGPVSERLFVECIDRKPGFCGNIDFIHKVNLDALFTMECSTHPDWAASSTLWYPTRLLMRYEDAHICFTESKLLTQNDIAYSVQRWQNKGDAPITVSLKVEPSCPVKKEGSRYEIQSEIPVHGLLIHAVVGWDQPAEEVQIGPGETLELVAAAAVGNSDGDTPEETKERLEQFLAKDLTAGEYIENGVKEYEDFFAGFPEFDSSDAVLNKTWCYRTYILRNATSNPHYGLLQYPTVYEGRGHKTKKGQPFATGGWEFSRLISLSSPLHMTDYRWYADKKLLHQFVRGYYSNLTEDGLNPCVFVNEAGGSFANYLVWAVYRMYLVDGDLDFVKEMLPSLKKNVDGNAESFRSQNDSLMVEERHQRTGKECQPSFWYFSNYPFSKRDRKHMQTPLKRVDSSIYHYLNTLGLARLMEAAGDAEAKVYFEKAAKIASDMKEKSWDPETKFFYDVSNETDEKAMVRNIVGIYPYWAEITDKTMLEGFETVFDPEIFNTGCLFATTEKTNPAYSPMGAWLGFMVSRDSCMWNGPSWPYTNGIVLDAMGKQSRANGHCYDQQFAKYLREYSMQHYRYQDINLPYLVEQYHGVTGEDLSDEPDYNHSFYMDLIVNYVVGLDPREDGVVIDPLQLGLERYSLKNVCLRGHQIEISYTKDDGLTLLSDGKEVLAHETQFPKVIPYNEL